MQDELHPEINLEGIKMNIISSSNIIEKLKIVEMRTQRSLSSAGQSVLTLSLSSQGTQGYMYFYVLLQAQRYPSLRKMTIKTID